MAQAAMNIRREQGALYGELIDVCRLLGVSGQFGSAPNALLHIVAESDIYQEAVQRLRQHNGPETKDE